MKVRRIGVVTFARSEYGSCAPLLRAIRADANLSLLLFVSGMHLSPEFGYTVRSIEEDGFEITDRIEMLMSSDTPEGIGKSNGLGTIGFAQSFARVRPDLLVVAGDRFELLSAACAAVPLKIPIAHISGGDITEAMIDDQVRHAMTKLSHIHFVAMDEHAMRVRQMGEEPWRVVVTGDPALDVIRQIEYLGRDHLKQVLNSDLEPPVIVVTFHPTTLGSVSVTEELDKLLSALSRVRGTFIFTYPNADAEGRRIIERIQSFVGNHPAARLVASLGQVQYYSLLAQADLMVGNSSSGLWEAPTFKLPAVNLGERQRGRLRTKNVIDVGFDPEAIRKVIAQGLDPSFRASLLGLVNPYGSGHAVPKIIDVLKEVELGPTLMQKRFVIART